jgi:hypothetical protein
MTCAGSNTRDEKGAASPDSGQPRYSSPDAYSELIDTLHAFTGIVLLGLQVDNAELRDRIVRNFLARGMTCLESIQQLWHMQHYGDCYALYRCLLDRLFHLYVLDRDDSFAHFDDWSFIEQFRCANYARSCLDFTGRTDVHVFSAAEKARYKALIKAGVPKWHRPDHRAVAEEMELEVLYHLGYAHASQHVHPMANDGEEDFERITIRRTEPRFDQRSVLSNSILVQLLLTARALNSSSFTWRRLLGDFLDESLSFLRTGDVAYQGTFLKIASQGPEFIWTEKRRIGDSPSY